MGKYDFLLDGIRYSYSSVSTYNTCPYAFKLSYIDASPRVNNFYAEYGSFVHKCFEKFFTENIADMELAPYYEENYDKEVKLYAPTPPYGLDERYKVQGQNFFNNFVFNKNNYDILMVEGKIDFTLDGVDYVAKPDLVVKSKKTGEYVLFDYKTSAPYKVDKRTGKETTDKKKLEGYYKQMYVYTYALRFYKDIPIDKIVLWYPRLCRQVPVDWDLSKEIEAMDWFTGSIEKIKQDEEFAYNNKEKYFCENLCSVRQVCKYR